MIRLDRHDLELYIDRLHRHAERLGDDVQAAKLRLAWADLERHARVELDDVDSLRLEAIGVLSPVLDLSEERTTIARREQQLRALNQLIEYVEGLRTTDPPAAG